MVLVVAGATFDRARLQATTTDASMGGTKLAAAGSITISQPLAVKSDCDLSELTINDTGAGVAILAESSTTRLDTIYIHVPKVLCDSKPIRGWELRSYSESACASWTERRTV